MITRKKAVIIISGVKANEIMPILRNHEALVEISDGDEILNIWKRNKTPIVSETNFLKVCRNYEGAVIVFDTEEQNIVTVEQEEITEKITKFCYRYKIEPGEFKVKNKANNSAAGCLFCDITRHPGMSTFEHNVKCDFVDMIVYESQNFVVVPGLGPLAPGYLMIMTKDHYLSLAQIPENLMEEYLEVEKDIESILKEMYKEDVGFYEHGTGPNGAVGLKSIVHMHVHVMLGNELKPEYRNMLNMKQIESVTVAKNESYFSYKWTSNGKMWIVWDPEVYIQRQFHRQVYAEEHGLAKDQFNWRKTAFSDLTKTNVWQLYQYLKNNNTNARIKARTNDFVKAGDIKFF